MLATTPLSPRWSFTLLDTRIQFRSMFAATLFLFIFLCLAYLSNPSETSFRSYLTEQSFRHHLSRLDDPADFDSDREGSNRSSSSSQSSSTFGSLESGSSAFHFSNRAAVALRTPRHAFHSFGLFTIAAVIPSHKVLPSSRDTPSIGSSARNTAGSPDPDPFPLKETWFVGAFGRWWRGGVVDPVWPPRHTPHLKGSEGGWSSGILNIKALDRLEDFNGLPFPTTTHSPRSTQRSSPPKLRSRRSSSCLRRSPTPPPPPLPQSTVLPLHAPKLSQSLTVPQPPSHPRSSPAQHPPAPSPANGATANGASPNFDSTPAVAELTQKINQTRALNLELRNQLSDHTNSATAADAALSTELSGIREAKRIEDVSRGELKARTKTLEDSRRAAEAGKRDAERRLRATQKAKAEAGTRIEKLADEIRGLEAQVQEDQTTVEAAGEVAAQEELEIRAQVKRCKREVRVAEEVVTALNVRVRELEESVERERIALASARENAEVLRREQQNLKHNFILKRSQDPWDAILTSKPGLPDSGIGYESLDPFPTPLEKGSDRDRDRGSSGTMSSHSSPHLHSPGTILPVGAGFGASSQLQPVGTPEALARRAKGYSIFDEDLATLPHPTLSSNFLPFRDSDADTNVNHALTLLPNGLDQSPDDLPGSATVRETGTTDELLSKSFQSDNDAFLERDWSRRLSVPESTSAVGSSALDPVFPHIGDESAEAFDLYGMPPRRRLTSDPMDAQRVWPSRTSSELLTSPINVVPPPEARTRWWWPGADKERRSTTDGNEQRKGLNPDAKVFNFSRKPLFGVPPLAPLDRLNPSASSLQVSAAANGNCDGTGATATAASGSTSGFLSGLAMRAFAPSPEEREALQRALGGSTNGSLERLPSLSEVGNMPTSPVPTHEQTHAAVTGHSLGLPWFDVNPGATTRRSWLRDLGVSVPRPGKIRFSPWGDSEGDGVEAEK